MNEFLKMSLLYAFILSLFIANCYAFNVKEIGNKISQLTSELGLTESDDRKDISELCAKKCSKEIEELKKNMTELYMAFLSLHAEFAHMNQHMIFHEKALKHIAVWGHRSGHHTSDHHFEHQTTDEMNSRNESDSSDDQMTNSTHGVDLNGRGQHSHRHQHHGHHQHHHHHHHKHCDNQHNPNIGGEDEDKKKDGSEEPPLEQVSTNPLTNLSKVVTNFELKSNKTISANASKPTKRIRFSEQSLEEQLKFQTMETEFREWFDNMLNDIHSSQRRGNDRTGDNQKSIDEMETALNSEELIFATCRVRPNQHIALLNQQDIEGTINIWQLKENRGPLHMHIKLKGFKVSNHNHNQNGHNHNGHSNGNREVRETNLMPVEQEPDEEIRPMGASHSHGFHVHESGDLSRDCQSVGSHYNPLNLTHGGPYDVVRHVGDLGNIRCNKNGEIDSEYTFTHISLSGDHSIINRSLVIHSNRDDYGRNPNSPSSSTTGSSGVRIACCLIEEVKTLPQDDDSQSSIGSVDSPAITSKRRRDTSGPALDTSGPQNRYEESNLSEILKKFAKYENELKYKTLMNFNDRQRLRIDD